MRWGKTFMSLIKKLPSPHIRWMFDSYSTCMLLRLQCRYLNLIFHECAVNFYMIVLKRVVVEEQLSICVGLLYVVAPLFSFPVWYLVISSSNSSSLWISNRRGKAFNCRNWYFHESLCFLYFNEAAFWILFWLIISESLLCCWGQFICVEFLEINFVQKSELSSTRNQM